MASTHLSDHQMVIALQSTRRAAFMIAAPSAVSTTHVHVPRAASANVRRRRMAWEAHTIAPVAHAARFVVYALQQEARRPAALAVTPVALTAVPVASAAGASFTPPVVTDQWPSADVIALDVGGMQVSVHRTADEPINHPIDVVAFTKATVDRVFADAA